MLFWHFHGKSFIHVWSLFFFFFNMKLVTQVSCARFPLSFQGKCSNLALICFLNFSFSWNQCKYPTALITQVPEPLKWKLGITLECEVGSSAWEVIGVELCFLYSYRPLNECRDASVFVTPVLGPNTTTTTVVMKWDSCIWGWREKSRSFKFDHWCLSCYLWISRYFHKRP